MHVLVVEDDSRVSGFLVKGLKAEGYATSVAPSYDEALSIASELAADISLVLLDLGLPGRDGIEVLLGLRAIPIRAPVIILTARHETQDKIRGLDAGATDFVTKPFAFDELLARIRAALRTSTSQVGTTLAVADLTFDLVSKVAYRGDRMIELSQREWALLELFMSHPHQVLSRVQILNRVWDYGFDPESNIVDVYVGYLRRKLNSPDLPPLLQTVRGAGYRLLPPGEGGREPPATPG